MALTAKNFVVIQKKSGPARPEHDPDFATTGEVYFGLSPLGGLLCTGKTCRRGENITLRDDLNVKAHKAVDDARVAVHSVYDDASVAAHNALKGKTAEEEAGDRAKTSVHKAMDRAKIREDKKNADIKIAVHGAKAEIKKR